jgi:hypothetical protein
MRPSTTITAESMVKLIEEHAQTANLMRFMNALGKFIKKFRTAQILIGKTYSTRK